MKIDKYKGDLIKEIRQGKHEVITHCVDVSNNWGDENSLSYQLDKEYNIKSFNFKTLHPDNNISLLGNINPTGYYIAHLEKMIYIVTCYVSINNKAKDPEYSNIDYLFLAACLKKIDYAFRGRTISMGYLGKSSQKADMKVIGGLVKKYLKNCDIKIVEKQ